MNLNREIEVPSSTLNSNLYFPGTCGECHDKDYVRAFRTSVHGQGLLKMGLIVAPSCNDCHGNHGAAPPGVASVGNVCGTCHALIAERFRNSSHAPAFAAAGAPCARDPPIRPAPR